MSDTQRHLNSDLEVVVSTRASETGLLSVGRTRVQPADLVRQEDTPATTALASTCQGQALQATCTCTACSRRKRPRKLVPLILPLDRADN